MTEHKPMTDAAAYHKGGRVLFDANIPALALTSFPWRTSYNKRLGSWSVLHGGWCLRGETSIVFSIPMSLDSEKDRQIAEFIANCANQAKHNFEMENAAPEKSEVEPIVYLPPFAGLNLQWLQTLWMMEGVFRHPLTRVTHIEGERKLEAQYGEGERFLHATIVSSNTMALSWDHTEKHNSEIKNTIPDTSEVEPASDLAQLEEIYKEVFGYIGDEPNVYADYDRCCELKGNMRRILRKLMSSAAGIRPVNVRVGVGRYQPFADVNPDLSIARTLAATWRANGNELVADMLNAVINGAVEPDSDIVKYSAPGAARCVGPIEEGLKDIIRLTDHGSDAHQIAYQLLEHNFPPENTVLENSMVKPDPRKPYEQCATLARELGETAAKAIQLIDSYDGMTASQSAVRKTLSGRYDAAKEIHVAIKALQTSLFGS